MTKKVVSYVFIVFIGLVMALNYQLFVFPNSFAPAGINGILTMVQHLFGFKLSNANMLVNLPLAIGLFITGYRSFAVRGMVFILSFSVFLMLLDRMDLSAFAYSTTVSTLLGPIVAGLIGGVCGYYMHQMGSCLGGTDFIAKIIHKKNPSFNFFTTIFVLNTIVAAISYFVYDYKIEPVLLCILYSYMSSSVRDNLNRKHLRAVRCEIVTEEAEALGKDILEHIHHSATVMHAKGLYTGRDKSVLVCIVNLTQVAELTRLVEKYPGSFVTVSHVNTVMGNFKRLDSHSKPELELLDDGSAANR